MNFDKNFSSINFYLYCIYQANKVHVQLLQWNISQLISYSLTRCICEKWDISFCSSHAVTNYLPFDNVPKYTRRIVARRIVRLSLATPPSTLYAPFDIVPNTFAFSLSQHHTPTFSPFRVSCMCFSLLLLLLLHMVSTFDCILVVHCVMCIGIVWNAFCVRERSFASCQYHMSSQTTIQQDGYRLWNMCIDDKQCIIKNIN